MKKLGIVLKKNWCLKRYEDIRYNIIRKVIVISEDRILVVDDDDEIRSLVEIYLKNDGFIVHKAVDGLQALEMMEKGKYDLVILDLMMPVMDGIQCCMRIRQKYDMPIIMLTAKNQDMDKIAGLSMGADDYMTKPFNPLELLARVKSQIRRYKGFSKISQKKDDRRIEIGELAIDEGMHTAFVGDKEVRLTKTEFDILFFLAKNRGMVFSAEKIYESLWQEESFDSENTVMVHIRKIREKIEVNPRNPQYIKTVWGVGYKIEK